jgi:excisionase family DNA binding protein
MHDDATALAKQIDPLLTDHDVARLIGRARSTLQKDRLTPGKSIPFLRLGRQVRYRRSQVEAWLSAHPSLDCTRDPAGKGA